MQHKNISGTDLHVPYAWTYLDAAAREAATGLTEADIGKLALQQSDNSLWSLTSITPTWNQVGTGASPGSHTHAIDDVTGLQTALDGKAASDHNHAGVYADATHGHTIDDVTGLQTALDGKAASDHVHALDDLSDVTTAGATTGQALVKQGDGTWAPGTVSGGGGGEGGTAVQVPVRQTVLMGRTDANGQANFLEALTPAPVLNKIVGNLNNSTDRSSLEWVTLRLPEPVEILAARIVVYANGGSTVTGTRLGIAEVELYNGATKLDGLTATATSSFSGYPASNAVNGVAVAGTVTNSWFAGDSVTPSDAAPVNLMVTLAVLSSVDQFRFVHTDVSPNTIRQPKNFEIQFTTDPTAVVGDAANSIKWFAVDLLNGKADSTEQAMDAETGGTAITPTAGALVSGSGFSINLKATEKPVVLAFADGFDNNGAVDHVKRITADVPAAWTLPANATRYLYIDRDPITGNLSYGVSEVAPKYEPGSPALSDTVSTLSPMTGYTSGTITVSASTDRVGLEAWRAFDGNTSSGTVYWVTAPAVNSGWLKTDYGLGITKVITQYVITPYQNAIRDNDPYNWTFEGSNDDINWDVLDSKSAYLFTSQSSVTFTVSNTTGYRYYRLNVARCRSTSTALVVTEFDLREPSTDVHWFDLSTFKMKVWNGSAWVEKTRVFIGEAVSDGTGILSVVAYALHGRYRRPATSLSNNTTFSINHNIGQIDVIGEFVLINKATGHRVLGSFNAYYDSTVRGMHLVQNTSVSCYIVKPNATSSYLMVYVLSGTVYTPTTNVDAEIILRRPW